MRRNRVPPIRRFCLATGSAIWILCLLLLPAETLAQPDRKQPDRKQGARAVAPKTTAAAPRAPVLSDEGLQRAIARRFAQSKIGTNGFSVSVSGGIATLSGVAQVSQHKGVATRLAKAAGAREVINRIEISPEARAKARARLKDPASRPPKGRQPDREGAAGQGRKDDVRPSPSRSAVAAPPAPSRSPSDSAQEPEAIERSRASKLEGSPKRFRIVSGNSAGEAGSAEKVRGESARQRRY